MFKRLFGCALAVVLALMLGGCASGPRAPEESGLFVDHEEAIARGGASNYAARDNYTRLDDLGTLGATNEPLTVRPESVPRTDRVNELVSEMDGRVIFESGSAQLSSDARERLTD